MPFFDRVYEAVRAIPRGRVATYGQVARLVGVPRGARAVGWALRALDPRRSAARCPGIAWSGRAAASPSGRARGPALQRRRLRAEGVRLPAGRVDLRRHGLLAMSHPGPRGTLEESRCPPSCGRSCAARRRACCASRAGKVTKTVYLCEGRLIFATSTDPDDRLGEMLLRKGLITYRSLEESVRAIKAGKRQGTLLVESGSIRSKDLVEGVTEQVQEIIYSLFQWDDGDCEFQEGDLPSREVIVLRMSTADLIMEGVRRVERWSRIRRRWAASTSGTAGRGHRQRRWAT